MSWSLYAVSTLPGSIRVETQLAEFTHRKSAVDYAVTIALNKGEESWLIVGPDESVEFNPEVPSEITKDNGWALVAYIGLDGDEKVVAKFSTEEAALAYANAALESDFPYDYRQDSVLADATGFRVERWVETVPVDPVLPQKVSKRSRSIKNKKGKIR